MNSDNEKRFSNYVLKLLEKSGWYPRRDVLDSMRLPSTFRIFPAATVVLKEFGKLCVGEKGGGIECAQSTIVFEPDLLSSEADQFFEYAEIIQRKLYPLGVVDDGHSFLIIDEQGRVYYLMNELKLVDDHFDRALEKLLTGIKPKSLNIG